MKCKKCGAHYRTRELRCPYCGTANPKGEQWQTQRESAEKELQQLEDTRGKDLRLQAAHKAVNRVLHLAAKYRNNGREQLPHHATAVCQRGYCIIQWKKKRKGEP